MARVIAFMGESRREKVLFDGEPDDAREFLQNNYPRIHVEPGMDYGDDGPPADAVVQDDDGSRQFWNGRSFEDWRAPATASNPSNASTDATNAALAEENAALRAQLAAAERARDASTNDAPASPPPPPPESVPGDNGGTAPDDVRAALDAHRQGNEAATSAASASDDPTPEGQ